MSGGSVPTLSERRAREAEIVGACERHGAERGRVFGAVAGGAPAPNDVDLLVAVGAGTTLLDLAAMRSELTRLVGVPVDVVGERGRRRHRRAAVEAEAVSL